MDCPWLGNIQASQRKELICSQKRSPKVTQMNFPGVKNERCHPCDSYRGPSRNPAYHLEQSQTYPLLQPFTRWKMEGLKEVTAEDQRDQKFENQLNKYYSG
jgi:hypothetical protein